jgi:CubicO group peptidase (beta-lactamase class C family)
MGIAGRGGKSRLKRALFLFWLLFAVALNGVCAGSPIESHLGSVETEIRRLMDEREVPSYSVAIVHDGDVVYSRSFGFLRRETKEAATPETLYNIGSVTKTFTASQLARHRSGLPRVAPNSSKSGYTKEQLIRGLNRTKLVTVPGEKWVYSNFGYDLLGHALEIAADELGGWLQRELHDRN